MDPAPDAGGNHEQPVEQPVQRAGPADDDVAPAVPGGYEDLSGFRFDDDGPAPGGQPRLALVAIGGIVLGMILMGGAWLAFGSPGSDRTDALSSAAPRARAAGAPTVLGTQAAARVRPAALAGCRAVDRAQRAPLAAARPALDQWEVHVGAMNKLVVGAISLDQANAFWNQTRVGAARHVHAFLHADRAYRRGTAGPCPRPHRVHAASTPLHACAAAVAARDRVIRAAETAASTWNGHVQDMEMLRMGDLTPAKATQMWLASWRTGQRQLATYGHAVHAARGHHC